jgi:beta-xylosidase/GH35 family endo-1,4-beta-xylanase
MKLRNKIAAFVVAITALASSAQTQQPVMKDAFAGKFLIGCAVSDRQLTQKDDAVRDVIARHYNSIVAEDVMKSENIHPKENKYFWKDADRFVKFGEENNMFIIGHCLIWHSQLAKWFCVDKKGNQVSPEVLKQRMRDHIYTIMRRYKGRIKGWDVVNEAVLEDGSYRNSPFYQILGAEFIPLAFQYAHEADPDAELYYNDYGMDNPGRRDKVIEIVKDLKRRGLRIDAVGMQSHMGMDYPNFDEYEKSLVAFAATGCKVNATEWDMSALPSKIHGANVSDKEAYDKAMNPYPDGLSDEVSRQWNARMSKALNIFLKHQDVIGRVCFWGVSDGDSWKNNWPMKGRTDYPLAFDRNLQLKPFLREYIAPKTARFGTFSYSVKGDSETPNPLLPGCYPDPSIVRVGSDYYLVNSSFVYYPGVPIWHSTDLKHWERLGYVLNRPSQLRLNDGVRVSGGVYAPAIAYNPVNKLYYMINTLVDGGGNYYVTTPDPKSGNWSDPVWLPEVGGIDPSILFDNDGKAYIVNNDVPEGGCLYDGHRAIHIHEFDWRNGKTVGKSRQIVNGGVNIAEKPTWIEGPHLYHIGDKYFLMCAEGGTGPNHSEVMFESDSVDGEFRPCAINPILTQRDLSDDRANPVTCSGHADLVQDENGQWYAVFLAVRPYNAEGHDIMGRETYMLPVDFTSGQPVILKPQTAISIGVRGVDKAPLWTSQDIANDAFMLRNPGRKFYSVNPDGSLSLTASSIRLSDRKSPAMLCRWATENEFEFVTTVDFDAQNTNDFAGLVLFQDDEHNITFGISADNQGNKQIVLRAVNGVATAADVSVPLTKSGVELKAIADGAGNYRFYADGEAVGTSVSADILSTKTASNFTGTAIGIYATSQY